MRVVLFFISFFSAIFLGANGYDPDKIFEPIKYEPKSFITFDQIAQRNAARHRMQFLIHGTLKMVDDKSHWSGWAGSILGRQQLTKKEAKLECCALYEEILSEMQKTPIFQLWLREAVTRDIHEKPVNEANPVDEDRFALKIAFWDQNMDRYPQPYISQVRIARGMISYYVAKPDQSLELLQTEPLTAIPQ